MSYLLWLWSLQKSFLLHEQLPATITMNTGRQFGQRRPPLSVSIKRILDTYPDGQIFKVQGEEGRGGERE